MVTDSTQTLTLEQLSDEVARLLREYGLIALQQDHRVSAAPDMRTIRYYTSLGLLDRPIISGRQAIYTKRHLMQVLAIKALQALSLPLTEIQSRLYGLSDSELESVITAVSGSLKDSALGQAPEAVRTACWREIVIEPGLKVIAEESWQSKLDEAVVLDRIRAALSALSMANKQAHGGSRDEHSK